jgi:hypothetical protein
MFDPEIKSMKDIQNAAEVVRAFSASDTSQAISAMLDALIESYKLDLMRVLPDGLVRLQTAIQQTIAIRQVINGQTHFLPKI